MSPTPEFPQKNDEPKVSGIFASLLFVWDFLKVIIIAAAIIIPVRYFIFQPFIVSGKSMEPSFYNNEYLIIDELSYRFNEPQRGDVIVLRYPKDRKQFFVKRIIGLPGETVAVDNGHITIVNDAKPNGVTLDELYLPSQGISFPHNITVIGGKKTIVLGDNEYFMMGDNRLASSDSRDWGPLNEKDIIGKVFVRVLPLKEFKKFQTPDYSIN